MYNKYIAEVLKSKIKQLLFIVLLITLLILVFGNCHNFHIELYNLIIHNKMSRPQKTLSVVNYIYPFGESPSPSPLRVIETQTFASKENQMEKKSEMVRKQSLVSNPGIIKLLRVTEEQQKLVYEWQYVPHSTITYVRSKFSCENSEIWDMTRKLLIKKITFQLTILISYLAKMRIEADVSLQNIGITHDEKLKIYLSPRTRMGIRTELFLLSQYGQAKERLLRELNTQFQRVTESRQSSQIPISQSSHQFHPLNADPIDSLTSRSVIRPKQKIFKMENDTIPRRKMSIGNFDLPSKSEWKVNNDKDKPKSPKTPRDHKYSFQFNSPQKDNANSFDFEEDSQKDSFINHSKSIKIEFQQQQNFTKQRKRKDSYKVKITTYREYEVDDPNLFRANGQNQEDLFEYFAQRAHKQEQMSTAEKSPMKEQGRKQETWTTAPSSPPPSPHLSRTDSKNLEDRIKQARERSERMLTKIKSMKK